MPGEVPIAIDGVAHSFGSGALRKQILFDVSARIRAGEIVILTGPSGSGKTTLLTLIGALRATQEGSLTVLGQELRGASERTLVGVRRRIGFVFQLHNLLDALTVVQNVSMGLHRDLGLSAADARRRAVALLESVGLGDRLGYHPDQLSGGQKQRVAIARALVGRPRIVLADEPTASLDKASGREVVDRLRELARRDGAAVVLVTHDSRILDVADRIIHLEEGRMSTFSEAVQATTRSLLGTLAKSARVEELARQVDAMPPAAFARFLEDLTSGATQMLEVLRLGTDEAFELMLAQMLEMVTLKVGQLLAADRVSLLLADEPTGELYAMVAQTEGGRPVEIRMPASAGVAGHAFGTGALVNVPDAYASPLFNREVDQRTGYRTRSILCTPVCDDAGRPFAVMSLLNKKGAPAFDERDEAAVRGLAAQVGVILQTWHTMHQQRRGARPRVDGGGAEPLS